MKRIPYYITALLVGLLGSCNSFLDETPDNRTEIDSPEKIAELLVTAYPQASYFPIAEGMSDNADSKPTVAENWQVNTDAYHWEVSAERNVDTPAYYWNACYAAIASANSALAAIDKMGSRYGTDVINPLKGEALVARAYSHFMLAVFWSKTYNSATAATDLGIPYVDKPEKKVLEEYQRGTLQETFDKIEKDLLEGLPLLSNSYKQPKFHFTREAAYAFATRFYQHKADWTNVVKYADLALGNDASKNLRDYPGNYEGLQYAQLTVLYQSSAEKANLLVSSTSSLHARYFSAVKYGLTPNLLNRLFTGTSHPTSGTWAYGVYGNDEYLNLPKFREYFKYINITASIGYPYAMCVLLTYDEVLLNRAEAYFMLGENDKAIADLNAYLPKKTDGGTISSNLTEAVIKQRYIPNATEFNQFYAMTNDQKSFVKCVLELRRREFYHEGMRWLDNKRFRMEITHSEAKNSPTLTPDDPRRELQIPEAALALGITANPR